MIDFIQILQKNEVDFLICGGHAVAFHGYPRMTLDFDVLVKPNIQNAQRLIKAFNDFGLANMPLEPFCQRGAVFTVGVQPNQIDILTSVSTQDEDEIFQNMTKGRLDEFDVNFLSLDDLLRAKIEANRLKDQLDVQELNAIHKS